ncbi:hypothetical protein, partial [Selenomonas caprae]|uniref:hypothetical protein n=1 Tax=Selenomonas caprae TaxID=2606905 RepID=UPI001CA44F3E
VSDSQAIKIAVRCLKEIADCYVVHTNRCFDDETEVSSNIWLESCCMIHSALFSFQRTISLYLSEHFEVPLDSAFISYRIRL